MYMPGDTKMFKLVSEVKSKAKALPHFKCEQNRQNLVTYFVLVNILQLQVLFLKK